MDTATFETPQGNNESDEAREAPRTTCVVVGGGPGGMVLALLLARWGVSVTLLEAHGDFDRDFRGDTLHPSVMEIMDQLGLAEGLLELPHTRVPGLTLQTPTASIKVADLSRLKTRFPYITLMPQARFLEFLAAEARRYANFRLVMGASVRELIEEDGVVRGVRYRDHDGAHEELRALLTVGADGRFSRVRRLGGFEPKGTSPPMDIVWFRVPRKPEDGRGVVGRVQRGHMAVLLDRGDQWQVAYVVPKGGYGELHDAGIKAFKRDFAGILPEFADRTGHLQDWKAVSVLSVESNRCEQWYRAGLLLIGDAAHVMSPVGGVGINYAIQDAVVAANVLAGPLAESGARLVDLPVRYLKAVQRRREPPTRAIQAFQAFAQKRIVAPALRDTDDTFKPPLALRILPQIPVLRDLPARIIAFGVWPVHVKD